MKLKKEAELIYEEANAEKKTAAIGKSLPNRLSEFLVGSLGPNQHCIVILEYYFSCYLANPTTCFTKFPLEICRTNE
jgi:hypothetical protein